MEHLIVQIINKYGYLAIFVGMILESTGIPIPSEVIMLLGGALTTGLVISGIHLNLSLWLVVIIGILANLIGSLIAYYIGKTGGRALVLKYGKYLLIRPKDLAKSQVFFDNKGEVTIAIGRILPVVRTYISFPAGIAEMNLTKFIIFTLLGSLVWDLGLGLIGRQLASNWTKLASYSTPISLLFLILVLIGLSYWYYRRKVKATKKISAN